MARIFSYKKVTDEYRTFVLRQPDSLEDSDRITELCTIDGTTFVAIPDGVKLPEQPKEIAASVKEVTLSDDLISRIKAASPHVRLINKRVVEMIRKRYSVNDELKMLRLAPSDESSAYNDYVERCRLWGWKEKVKLGITPPKDIADRLKAE